MGLVVHDRSGRAYEIDPLNCREIEDRGRDDHGRSVIELSTPQSGRIVLVGADADALKRALGMS